MGKTKNINKIIIVALSVMIILNVMWFGKTFAYFTAKSSASGTITMGTLKIDGLKNYDGTEINWSISNLVPNQEFGGRYKAVVNSNINYYTRVMFKATVTPRSGATHVEGCADNVDNPTDVLNIKVGQTGQNIYTKLNSKSADGYAIYYKLAPTQPTQTITDEVFDTSLRVHDWVGSKCCTYYMGATINVSMKVELLQADFLESQNRGTTFENVQTMHDLWETCISITIDGPVIDEPVKDVSEYSELTFTVLDSTAKTMSVKAANTSITSANIPAKVLKDGEEYTVTNIPDDAFINCSNLTSVTIPSSVTSIYGLGFEGCTSLTSINVDSNNSNYCSQDGVLYNKDKTELVKYPAGKTNTTFTIPNSVTSIRFEAFCDCLSLTSVIIPDSVTNIEAIAFGRCGLTSVTIPDSVTNIGAGAFFECQKLASVIIGRGVTNIGTIAFEGCTSLTSINVNSNNSSYCSQDGVLYNKNKTELIKYPALKANTSFTIPDSVKEINENAFRNGINLNSITIPNSVSVIDYDAFENCTNLTSVTFNNTTGWRATNISEILDVSNPSTNAENLVSGNWSMLVCNCVDESEYTDITFTVLDGDENAVSVQAADTSITTANIPSYVLKNGTVYAITSIGDSAFENCASLKSVTIPDSVTIIGNYAFAGCTSLTSVKIPDSVTSIEEGAFYDCTSLASVTIPSSVTNIGLAAFFECMSLTAINVDSNNANYSSQDGVFYNKDKTKLITYPAEKTNTTFTIPNSVTSIGEGGFYGCTSLTSVTIPNSVTSIGYSAFAGCGLTTITIPSSVTSIGAWAFAECSSLKSVTIENGVTSIGAAAFYGCSSLTTITIPNSVTSIGGAAFEDCSSLTSIEIPNSVTSICAYAFAGCGLTTVTIPNSVTSIGAGAFAGCENLTSVTFDNTTGWRAQGSDMSAEELDSYISDSSFMTDSFKSGCPQLVCNCLGVSEYPNLIFTVVNSSERTVSVRAANTSITTANIPAVVLIDGFVYAVTAIEDDAFRNCTSLTSVTIPDSVTIIGNYAFAGCTSLTSVKIESLSMDSSRAIRIGFYVFKDCSSLDSIVFTNISAVIDNDEGQILFITNPKDTAKEFTEGYFLDKISLGILFA